MSELYFSGNKIEQLYLHIIKRKKSQVLHVYKSEKVEVVIPCRLRSEAFVPMDVEIHRLACLQMLAVSKHAEQSNCL